MNDRPKNPPIRIPINFVDSPSPAGAEEIEPYDDAIEIDGDALEMDESETAETDATLEADAGSAEELSEEPAPEQTREDTESSAREAEADTREAAIVNGATGQPEDGASDATLVEETVAEPREEPARPAAQAAGAEGPQAARPELSVEAFKRLTQELRQKTEQAERLGAEKNDLFDRLLRKQAEFENFRKRSEREMQEAYRRARADILLDILPAIDNIERALSHAENADPGVLREGVALIYKQLADTLGRHGLEAIDAVGKPFDPELHEAVAAEQTDEVADHTVLEELQRGYKLGDRLLRPARVKVSLQS